jgi:hypothetical protein
VRSVDGGSTSSNVLDLLQPSTSQDDVHNILLGVLLGLSTLRSADLLDTLLNFLTSLGTLGKVVSPGNLGTVGVEELEVRSKFSSGRLVPSSSATALADELKKGRKRQDWRVRDQRESL